MSELGESYEALTNNLSSQQQGELGMKNRLVEAGRICQTIADRLSLVSDETINGVPWDKVVDAVGDTCRALDGARPKQMARVVKPLVRAVLRREVWLNQNYRERFGGDVAGYVGDTLVDYGDPKVYKALAKQGLKVRTNRTIR